MKCLPLLLIALAFASCKPAPPPVSPEEEAQQDALKSLRSAAAGVEVSRMLAQAQGATEQAKEDLAYAKKRMSQLERRAEKAGVDSKDIDAEVLAGQKTGQEEGRKTLEERAARKAEEAKP